VLGTVEESQIIATIPNPDGNMKCAICKTGKTRQAP